jgi:hypothetical protein
LTFKVSLVSRNLPKFSFIEPATQGKEADMTTHFDALSAALFDGPVKAADFKTLPGSNEVHDRELVAKELLLSMKRMGIVVDGQLVDVNNH